MKRRFKCVKVARHFVRYGEGLIGPYKLTRWRSFSSLRAAMTALRLDVAEIEADGLKQPLSIAISYEHVTRAGAFKASEVVALWKRGRFVWVDPLLKRRERRKR